MPILNRNIINGILQNRRRKKCTFSLKHNNQDFPESLDFLILVRAKSRAFSLKNNNQDFLKAQDFCHFSESKNVSVLTQFLAKFFFRFHFLFYFV